MNLNNKNIILLSLTILSIVSITYLFLNPIKPEYKKISEVEKGDYVVLEGYIQKMYVKRDDYRHIIDIYKITINDGSGNLDIIVFGNVRKDLLNYILNYTPSIKEGDKIKVVGKVSEYNGKYEIILDDINNFMLIQKNNFKRDIYLSPYPTNIYASKYGKTYHVDINCPYGKRIKNKIYFYSEEDAKELGYKPCKKCCSSE
ncbi:OB-fold nucleic acid binding domain-containing protein [Methanocaldococcus indicus]|uniref:OB-fold nucleic acid binding domain-containing protein n=1 Tax=Methanocaldococcus indicus TaxID=213231 RepID=UPI003C6D3AF1